MVPHLLCLVCVFGVVSVPPAVAVEDGSGTATLISSPAVRTGESLHATLVGPPGAAFVIVADRGDGPVPLGPHTICLDLSPFARVIAQDTLPASGVYTAAATVPNLPVLAGQVIRLQGFLLDANAPKGIAALSNGTHSVIHEGSRVLMQTFDGSPPQFNNGPRVGPYTGDYDSSVSGRLQGGPLQHRTVETGLAPGPGGVSLPFWREGARSQHVYPAELLGQAGDIIGMDWKPAGGRTVAEVYRSVEIRLSHSHVVPDPRTNPSGFPIDPRSGLDLTYADNVAPGESPVVVLPPSVMTFEDKTNVDWLPWPDFHRHFAYNGVDSLLVDLGSGADALANTSNFFEYHQVLPNWTQPFYRIYSAGGSNTGPIDDPFSVTVASGIDGAGTPGDTAIMQARFHLADVETAAVSPYLAAAVPAPDYRAAHAAEIGSEDGAIRYEFQGALDADGTGATGFSASIDVADGFPFIQFRAVFVSDFVAEVVPAIDTFVIAYD